MDILSTWPARLGLFLLAFPVVMFGVPFLIATLRQRFAWNKRRPEDAGMRGLPSEISRAPIDGALDDLLDRRSDRRYSA